MSYLKPPHSPSRLSLTLHFSSATSLPPFFLPQNYKRLPAYILSWLTFIIHDVRLVDSIATSNKPPTIPFHSVHPFTTSAPLTPFHSQPHPLPPQPLTNFLSRKQAWFKTMVFFIPKISKPHDVWDKDREEIRTLENIPKVSYICACKSIRSTARMAELVDAKDSKSFVP